MSDIPAELIDEAAQELEQALIQIAAEDGVDLDDEAEAIYEAQRVQYRRWMAVVLARIAPKIRSSALEEAARIADDWGQRKDQMSDTAFIPGASHDEKFAAEGIAASIRALKEGS